MADPLVRFAHEIRDLGRRVLSVERRFTDLAARGVRVFPDLDDVAERIVEHGPALTPGDAWGINDDGEWDIITPAGGGGGPGEYASISVTGLFDGTDITGSTVEWARWSSSALELTTTTAAAPTVAAIAVTEPGIYMVTGSAVVTDGSGFPTVTVRNWSTQAGAWRMTELDPIPCRDGLVASDDASNGGSVALLLPLGDTVAAELLVDVEAADEVRWRLQAHLVHRAPVLTGSCGD